MTLSLARRPGAERREGLVQPGGAGRRDPRLDFFRGLALLFIFINHIPDNVFTWLTTRSYGFSDAAEIFIFISGYAAALAYPRFFAEGGFRVGLRRVARRAGQVYLCHVATCLAFFGLLYTMSVWSPAAYKGFRTYVAGFLDAPLETLGRLLALQYQGPLLDILPLYVALLAMLPAMLWLARRGIGLMLALSAALYLLAQTVAPGIPAAPGDGVWFFNPLAWQLLFFIGLAAGLRSKSHERVVPRHSALLCAAVLYLLFALAIVMTWRIPALHGTLPQGFKDVLYPQLQKTTLDPLRLLHFFALAHLVATFVRRDSAFFRFAWAQAVIRCGQHSLPVFSAGLVLSLLGHGLWAASGHAPAVEIAVNLGGIGLLLGLGNLLARLRRRRAEGLAPRAAASAGAMTGGVKAAL